MLRFILTLAALAVAITLTACGGGAAAPRQDSGGGGQMSVERPPLAQPTDGTQESLELREGSRMVSRAVSATKGNQFKNRATSVDAGLSYLLDIQSSLAVSDGEARFRILSSTAGTPGTFTVAGDETASFTAGRTFTVSGYWKVSSTLTYAPNNGNYTCDTASTFDGTNTTITTAQPVAYTVVTPSTRNPMAGNLNYGPYDLWQWQVGTGPAYRNIQGEILDYLLRSGDLLPGKNDYDESAMEAIDGWLVPFVSEIRPYARGYSFEVGALLAAYEHTGDFSYAVLAADLALRTVDDAEDGAADGRYTGAEYADRFITQRRSLGGWDAGPYAIYWFQAGTAVGGDDGAVLQQWARDLLDAMWARKSEWEFIGYSGALPGRWLYTHSAYGMMLDAYSRVDREGYSLQRDYFRGKILAEQSADGYWYNGSNWASDNGGGATGHMLWDDLQATYSCLLGLDSDNQGITVPARRAGENYLRCVAIQQADGHFVGYDGATDNVSSFTAEAAYGLAVGLNRGE